MYKKWFYIENEVWNNKLSYNIRENKKLFVTSLIDWTIDDIKLWDEIVFEDFNLEWKLTSCKWLKNFYKIPFLDKYIYLFDNHNHALYFWYLEKIWQNLWENNILFHIDEHADMRIPEKIISKEETKDLKKMFEYTNYLVNVWNYIVPAIENKLFSQVIQLRNETNLLDYDFNKSYNNDVFLNLDLDFFQPDLDYIDYELKKKIILDIAKKAKVITVATSPFFIDQKLALKVFKDLFFNKNP